MAKLISRNLYATCQDLARAPKKGTPASQRIGWIANEILPITFPWLNASQIEAAGGTLLSQTAYPLEQIEEAHSSLIWYWRGFYGAGNNAYSVAAQSSLTFETNLQYKYKDASSYMLVGAAIGAGTGYTRAFEESGLCLLSSPDNALFLSDRGRNKSESFRINNGVLTCALGMFTR